MQQPPPPPPSAPEADYPEYHVAKQSTWMGTTSLILGLVSLPLTCVLCGPLLGAAAVVLGIVGLVQASADPLGFGGKGRSIAGVVTGALSVVLLILMLPTMSRAYEKFSELAASTADLQSVQVAIEEYLAQHEQFPPNLAVLFDRDAPAGEAAPGVEGFPLSRVHYVANLPVDAPPTWILTYVTVEIMGRNLYAVVSVSGELEVLQEAEFNDRLQQFKEAYQQKHGEPPQIIAPEDRGEAETPVDAPTPAPEP